MSNGTQELPCNNGKSLIYRDLQIDKMHKSKSGKHFCLPLFIGCTPAGARTLDTLIKSQVLYQLSYGCITFYCFIQLFC